MTYVLQIADDETLDLDEGLLKSLHFMMLKYDLTKNPGRWRPGAVYVRDGESGEIVYEGAPSDDVARLVAELFADVATSEASVVVKAAMAHLNLVMIHPFSDGNGRMARCLQTLILARDRVLAPVFASIEEFLGRNTETFYSVLAEVGDGSWQPERDARPWIRFCLRAHYTQVRTMLRRREEIEALWNACHDTATTAGLPERCASGLMDAAYELRIRRKSYRTSVETVTGDEISDLTASRDLKAMVDSALLAAVGEKRGRYYVAGEDITALRKRIRAERPPKVTDDPFTVVRERRQLSLT